MDGFFVDRCNLNIDHGDTVDTYMSRSNTPQIAVEAVAVGSLTLLVGVGVGFVLSYLPRPTDPKQWNKYHVMELSLFVTGVLIHLICEGTGLNRYYCLHGNAAPTKNK
jgi:NhaP-type Na+/H+ or K+/H+ antiporter